MHAITRNFMKEHQCYFTSYYADGVLDLFVRMGWLDFTVLGGRHKRETEEYFCRNNLNVDTKSGNGCVLILQFCSLDVN